MRFVIIGFILTLIQTVFITLKLAGAVLWSWWVVLIPFWIVLPVILIVIYFAIRLRNTSWEDLMR